MVDRDLLFRKLANLDEYVQQVSEFSHTTVEQYRTDWKTQRIIERTLQMAIETSVDIANHVIGDRRLRVPSTYADVFEVLGEAGLLEASLVESLVAMTRLRNVLVHGYTRVDPVIIMRILGQNLDDFRRFAHAVLGWLQASAAPGEP